MLLAKVFAIGAVCLLNIGSFADQLNIPTKCRFTKDDFSITPSEQAFNKLKELECPEVTYTLPGYYSTNVTEYRFIIYHEWRGGIAGSKIGVCSKSTKLLKTMPKPTYNCSLIEPE
jgi:hypothetical protein